MNGAPYNFSDIWSFPINGGGESSWRPPFPAEISRFAGDEAVAADPDSSGTDSMNGRRRDASEEVTAKSVSTSSATVVKGSDSKRLKTSGYGDDDQSSKAEGEGMRLDQGSKSQTDPPKDYIHVRARRGQATDSHSLAERARREKISERMKLLQDIVPGCNKVLGKALVLDEIINYIQSLQRQVEFLSMKLETVSSRMELSMEGYPSKDFVQQTRFGPSVLAYESQAPRKYERGPSPEWLRMQVGSGYERPT